MADFPSRNDLTRIAEDEALSVQSRLSLEAFQREGSDANVLTATAVAAADEVIGQLIDVEAGLFLDSAEGQALDRLIFDRYGLVRKPAAPGLTSAEFSTTAPNPASFPIPIGTILATPDGVQFVVTAPVSFPLGATGPVVVPVRSSLAGLEQRAKIGALTGIVSAIAGAPSDLVVTNSLATSGSDDAELDQSLRDRARRFFTTARRGTLAAIEQGALAVAGVRKARALEVLDVLGRPARIVQLIIADAFTDQLVDLAVAPPTYQAQSQLLSLAVFNDLADVRAAGIYVQVLVAQVVIQPVLLSLRFQAGVDVDQTALLARAIVAAYGNDRQPGGSWIYNDAASSLRIVPGLLFTGNEILSPLGDVVARPLQVIRTPLEAVVGVSGQSDVVLTTTANPDAFVIARGSGA